VHKIAKNNWEIKDDLSLNILCPNCNQIFCVNIDNEYDVNNNGMVFPSIRCSCNFHEIVILENYKAFAEVV
jgi:hypothetical protein